MPTPLKVQNQTQNIHYYIAELLMNEKLYTILI
jgi:hypothetical protein